MGVTGKGWNQTVDGQEIGGWTTEVGCSGVGG